MTLFQHLLAYLRNERRLMQADTWHGGTYHNRPTPEPLTREDPKCRAVLARQKWERRRLKRDGVLQPRVPIAASWAHDERHFRFLRSDR